MGTQGKEDTDRRGREERITKKGKRTRDIEQQKKGVGGGGEMEINIKNEKVF